MVIHVAHQHGVDFHLFETGVKGGIDARHHLTEFVLTGNRMELTRIQTIHANIDARQPASRQFAASRASR